MIFYTDGPWGASKLKVWQKRQSIAQFAQFIVTNILLWEKIGE